MTKKPPIPAGNRSGKGKGKGLEPELDDRKAQQQEPKNLSEQGEQANIRQNTRNQGYQQDR